MSKRITQVLLELAPFSLPTFSSTPYYKKPHIYIHVDIPFHMSKFWTHACKQLLFGHPLNLKKPTHLFSQERRESGKKLLEGHMGREFWGSNTQLNLEMGTRWTSSLVRSPSPTLPTNPHPTRRVIAGQRLDLDP